MNKLETNTPTVLIIIGITGDLSRRKLLPAIEAIVKAKAAPNDFKIIGITRQKMTSQDLLSATDSLEQDFLPKNLKMFQMNLANEADYIKLKKYLDRLEASSTKKYQRLFYLSVPPQVSEPIVKLLGKAGFSDNDSTKLLLEKPFGYDLDSAQDLVGQTRQFFNEDQIYRIDHYMAKEMSQNLLVFRDSNSLFKRTWNKDFIKQITIIASEKIGIEGRGNFYEQTGAVRDLVQSHLLELAALTLLDWPETHDYTEIPKKRHQALASLSLLQPDISQSVKRAQYIGYREEADSPYSTVETFVDLTLKSSMANWEGVPIRLVTGKNLKRKLTEIRLTYQSDPGHTADELIIRLQPNEGISLDLWAKVPGYELKLEKKALGFTFKEHYPLLPEAYEQVLLDAIHSDHTFFTSSEEVLESWRLIDPILAHWSMQDEDLVFYNPGSSEPELRALFSTR